MATTTDYERLARIAKAERIIATCEERGVTCASLALLDPEGRRALEQLAGTKPAGRQTWGLAIYGLCYRAAHRAQGNIVDPFDGWTE